jgi:polyisoprenoid-binding protein YceI
MRKIDARGLKRQLDHGGELLLINALEPVAFEKQYVPGVHSVERGAPATHRPDAVRRGAVWLGCALLLVAGAAVAAAQTRWHVDPKESLVWWQVSPNLNHLWATTCPEDRSWRPGEGRSGGWDFNTGLQLSGTRDANVDDTIHMPLYPRGRVYPVCTPAVNGEVVVGDTADVRNVHGAITVLGDALVTGEAMRDGMMHRALATGTYPYIKFSLDSLRNVTQQGDTLRGEVVGTLTIRDVQIPTTAEVQEFPDAGGRRVLAKWRAQSITDLEHRIVPRLGIFGMGIQVWHYFYMGADLILRHD